MPRSEKLPLEMTESSQEQENFMGLTPRQASPPAAPRLPIVLEVPGEKDSHVVMGRVEVTLGVDALLPLTEAGQRLLRVVNYFQPLLEREAEVGGGEWTVDRAHHIRHRKQPRGMSSGQRVHRHWAGIWQRPA